MKSIDQPFAQGSGIEIATLSSDQPFGISIVGMAQAGKTTLRNGITEAWRTDFDPNATIVHFSNSDGFRGLTAEVIEVMGVPTDTLVSKDDALSAIAEYISSVGICDERLNVYYHRPRPEAVLRTTAVNTMVTHVSDHPLVRPAINRAGSRFMSEIIEEPSIKKLDKKPNLFVLDARNIAECNEKFLSARIRPAGAFILICDEAVVVDRVANTSGLSRSKRIKILTQRNEDDRNHTLGRMSMPEDFPAAIHIAEAVRIGDITELRLLGAQASVDPENIPIVLDTAGTSEKQTLDAMPFVISGLINAPKLVK